MSTTEANPPVPARTPEPSFRAVHLLFFIVVCLQVSNLFLFWMPQYVRMILNEALFVFLPGYLFLRITRQPVGERVRWQWPGWKIAGLSLLVGAGLYPLSAAGAGVLMTLLGYTSFALPADAIPNTLLMSVLAVVAYAVMAPLCEEFLFRGVIQPVYETRGPGWAVVWVGFLFIAFHLSLLQGLSIILLALALGFVNYRTRSLPASILTHFGANVLAALVVTQQVFKTGIQAWITSPPQLVGGPIIAGLALVGLAALTRRPVQALPAAEPIPSRLRARPGGLAAGWPLLAVALLYFPLIGAEFVFSRNPNLAADWMPVEPLTVSAVEWTEAQTWRYEIRNVADSVVGEGQCQLLPEEALASITCRSRVDAYEVKRDRSFYSSSGGERIDRLTWQPEDGCLLSSSSELNLTGGSFRSEWTWQTGVDTIDMRWHENNEPERSVSLPFSETPLVKNKLLPVVSEYTWPWQLAGMPLEVGEAGSVVLFLPNAWNNQTKKNGPLAENQRVTIEGKEEVVTPAGKFSAWKVRLGSARTAWYAVDDRHTLVMFFNGVETWSLK